MDKAIPFIFDLDGTLWDARREVAQAWGEVSLRRYGKNEIDEAKVASVMGLPMNELALAIAPDGLTEEEKYAFGEEAFAYENVYLSKHPGHPFEEVGQTLKALKAKGHSLFIVSNCQKGYIETFLPTIDSSSIEDYLCYGDTLGQKADTIRALMKKHGLKEAIYVGDTEGDEREAKKAGCLFCFASYGFGKSHSPDYVIKTFSDLLKLN